MVRLFAVLALVAGCTEEIASGVYLCGPEGLCPDGMVCNGGVGSEEQAGNVCVFPGNAEAFTCGTLSDPAGDDAPPNGQILANLGCVSGVREAKGCLRGDDVGDWFQFDAPATCTAVQVVARVTFPLAFEPIALQIASDGAEPVAAETECTAAQAPAPGEAARCFKQTLANGSHHSLGLVHAGFENCDGGCRSNRYKLLLQLSTP